mgnify:FL=1|jgi:hypothetical protein|tara:strand:+ start:544 stop:1143 length:600 start_codon:yes stop_codon:yes gene_type:complete
MTDVSLLFYSNKCQNCKKIVGQINETPVRNSLRFVCIDDPAIRKKLPPYIKSVPTLVVGRTNQIHVGNQILGYIKMMSLQKVNEKQKKPVVRTRHATPAVEPTGPSSFSISEMGGGYSDNYSFVDVDCSSQGNGGSSMSHSFDFISKQDLSSHQTENIQNVSNYGSIEQKDEKVDELSKRMEDMMNRRSIDVPAKPMRQ